VKIKSGFLNGTFVEQHRRNGDKQQHERKVDAPYLSFGIETVKKLV
jgi:hypothetical protein